MASDLKILRQKDPLLQPLHLKGLVLKNRIMSTSHAAGLDEDEMPKERYQLYHEEKAKGGLALTMFGGSANVAPDSPSVFDQLNVGNDRIIPYFQEFSERIHKHGAALMCQITHLGRRGKADEGYWLPTIAPSRVRESKYRSFPKEMDEDDIARVVRAFGEAARRCKEGFLDGIEVFCGGHLVGQFFSLLTNKRADRFGGALTNRCRFGLMVYEEIRRQVGDDFSVGMRLPVEEDTKEGLSFDECVKIAQIFESEGLVDFFNLMYGRIDTELSLALNAMPGMGTPSAPALSRVGEFKQNVNLPVFHALRITDVATARYALQSGLVDMIGMTRALFADPYLVEKVVQGKEERIRPCIGATYCLYKKVTCIHNPATGREKNWPHKIKRSDIPGRKVVVVGGGPAGLEAARVSAERGHEVILLEAAAKLGGQVLIAARASWRRDLIGIIEWRKTELEHLGAKVHLNVYATPQDVIELEPDVVILATGGLPDLLWLAGADHCVSVWDVLTGQAPLSHDVLIYDGTGDHQALSCADHLAGEGRNVTLITPDILLGQNIGNQDRTIYRKRFYELEIDVIYDHRLLHVMPSGNLLKATFINEYTGKTIERQTDQVVVEHGSVPNDELYRNLRHFSRNNGVTNIDAFIAGRPQPNSRNLNGQFDLYRIGDAVSSRNIHMAIFDAFRLCSAL
jgi:2,4-dienoyl-CoA reductase-like NADH-dependent reductase (Old Yellow Enzyme family)/thioredoxin reductase